MKFTDLIALSIIAAVVIAVAFTIIIAGPYLGSVAMIAGGAFLLWCCSDADKQHQNNQSPVTLIHLGMKKILKDICQQRKIEVNRKARLQVVGLLFCWYPRGETIISQRFYYNTITCVNKPSRQLNDPIRDEKPAE